MRAEFLNEIHDVQILRTFRLVRGLISVLRNVSAAGTFPFSFYLVGSCVLYINPYVTHAMNLISADSEWKWLVISENAYLADILRS